MGNNFTTEDIPICKKCHIRRIWQKQYGLCNYCLVEFALNNLNNPDILNNINQNGDNKTKINNKTKSNGGKLK